MFTHMLVIMSSSDISEHKLTWMDLISGECKAFKEKFMKCLRDNSFDNSMCRLQSKDYLECRMDQ